MDVVASSISQSVQDGTYRTFQVIPQKLNRKSQSLILILTLTPPIEPTDDWTIEQLLQWCHQRSQSSINQKTDGLVNALQELYDNAERDIWDLHRMAVSQNADMMDTAADTENIAPVGLEGAKTVYDAKMDGTVSEKPTAASNNNNASAAAQTKKTLKNLFIEIQSGPHEGATFLLKPRMNRPCEIGRSKGKKFLQRGISLFKDTEVSTCHGKFEYKAGKMFFTDTGSTNGTSFMGEAIEDNCPIELVDGMVIVVGDSELKFAIVDN